MAMHYYSARLHKVCIVDEPENYEEGKYTCDYSFVIFRADSYEDAFQRALGLGRDQETIYKNSEGNDVRWALNAVEEVTELEPDLDGIEIGSILDEYVPKEPIGITTVFQPELPTLPFKTEAAIKFEEGEQGAAANGGG